MTTAPPFAPATTDAPETDRNLALLVYGLLFFAPFCAGLSALVGAVIAHSRRRTADSRVRSHHRFQMLVFWIALGLTMIATLLGLGALAAIFGDLVSGGSLRLGWTGWGVDNSANAPLGDLFFHLLIATMTAAALTSLWLMGASAYGFLRLASRRAIRQTRR